MNDDEIMNMWVGALIIIMIQLTLMIMIMDYEIISPLFKIEPATSMGVIAARFLASLLGHLNIEPEIRAGLILAKYCLNHPSRFRGARSFKDDGTEVIHVSQVFPPLFLAVSQVLIGLIVEVNILIFLTAEADFFAVICKFVCLLFITQFDNIYAECLTENKMKPVAGQKLKKYFFKHFLKF